MTVAARRRAALPLVLCLVAFVLGAARATAARAAPWGAPFELTTPGTLDYFGPQLAMSGSGAAAAMFSIGNVDTPGSWQAYLVGRSASGRVGAPTAVAGAQQVLSEAYDGRSLELLVGTAPSNLDCCSAVATAQVGSDGVAGRPHTLVGGLTGATQAQLLTLGDGQLTAAVATERGVWVAQSSRGTRFGSQQRISDRGQEPISLAAAWLGAQSTIVAWTAGTGTIGNATPRSIYYATGSRRQAPNHTRVALTVPAGHRVDELGVARRGHGATLAWIESWFDKRGNYDSRVEAADLAAGASTRALSPDSRLASGLSVASDAAGDEAVAWESCTTATACTVQAAGRPAKGTFGPARTLGAIDADETPSLAMAPSGKVFVAWVRGGHPVASVGFGAPTVLSASTFATDPAVVAGPGGRALEAWTQGTLNPSVVAAAYR